MAAKKKEIARVTPTDSRARPVAGPAPPAAWLEVVSVSFPDSGSGAQILEGDVKAAVAALIPDKPQKEAEGALMAKVWVVVQQREGQLPRISCEAAAAAQKLAAALGGGKPEAIVLGSGIGLAAAEVAKSDLALVHVADHEGLRNYTPGTYIGALAPAIRAGKPDFVVSRTPTRRWTTCRAWRRRSRPGCCPR